MAYITQTIDGAHAGIWKGSKRGQKNMNGSGFRAKRENLQYKRFELNFDKRKTKIDLQNIDYPVVFGTYPPALTSQNAEQVFSAL